MKTAKAISIIIAYVVVGFFIAAGCNSVDSESRGFAALLSIASLACLYFLTVYTLKQNFGKLVSILMLIYSLSLFSFGRYVIHLSNINEMKSENEYNEFNISLGLPIFYISVISLFTIGIIKFVKSAGNTG